MKAWAAQTTVDLKKGIHQPDSNSVTIKEVGSLWLETCEAEALEPEAIRVYDSYLRMHIYPAMAPKKEPNRWDGHLGDLKLSRLTTPICEVFKRLLLKTKARRRNGKFIDQTISRRTARHVLASLKTMLNDSQTRGLIVYNPALPVKIKSKKRERARLRIGVQIPDRPEILSIILVSSGMWRVVFKTLAFAGLRSSEVRALAKSAIRLEMNEIDVSSRADRQGLIGPCKSESGYRTVQISDDLVNEFRSWLPTCPAGSLELVFPNDQGNVLCAGRILEELYAVQKRIGLLRPDGRPKYNVHSLRHFFASIMIAEGTPPKRLQELLGHSTLAMTMDLYGHLFAAGEAEIARINSATAKVFSDAAD
jgi:integrase